MCISTFMKVSYVAWQCSGPFSNISLDFKRKYVLYFNVFLCLSFVLLMQQMRAEFVIVGQLGTLEHVLGI